MAVFPSMEPLLSGTACTQSVAPHALLGGVARHRSPVAVSCGVLALALLVLGACTESAPEIQRHPPNEVDSMYLGDHFLFVGMTADDCFAILTQEDVVEQTVEPDPEMDGSQITTKLYRVGSNEFEMEFRRFADPGPFVVSKIVIHAGLPAPAN